MTVEKPVITASAVVLNIKPEWWPPMLEHDGEKFYRFGPKKNDGVLVSVRYVSDTRLMDVINDLGATIRLTVNSIFILHRKNSSDYVSLVTDLPEPTFPFKGTLGLRFEVAKDGAVQYVATHFPGIPVQEQSDGHD